MQYKFPASVAIALLAFSAGFGQLADPGFRNFVEIPGEMEFTGEMIVRPHQMETLIARTGNHLAALRLINRARERVYPISLRYYPETDEFIVQVPMGSSENTLSADLMRTGLYEYVEPNWRVYPISVPNDPNYGQQWHLPKIQAPMGWSVLVGNPTQIIAYTDTGIDVNHPDLAPNRIPGYNAVDQIAEVNGGQVTDLNGHGTHVAGTGSAVTNNSIGVAGVGWNFRTMMVRVSNTSGGSSSIEVLTRGARWAVDNGAKTVSTSYSGVSSSAVNTTGAYIRARGSSYLWAAGNSNANLTADHPNVIIVGATTSSDTKASFSNYGPAIDVVAPGVNIYATLRNNSYGNMSGTSMAAPVANGVIAMIYARYPWLTPDEAEALLFATCVDLGPPGKDNTFGHGRVDLGKAMSETVMVTPNGLNVLFGTQIGGNLQSLLQSDDNKLVVRTAPPIGLGSHSTNVVVTGTSSVLNPSKLIFAVEQSASTFPVNLKLELFNYVTNSYEQVDLRAGTSGDAFAVVTITSNPSRFVHGVSGEVRASLKLYEDGAVALGGSVRYDLVRWEIAP
ncbi:MAG: S8 family serine peptidase [Fimbriimonadales bacterium]|nr:S8 family serine peptidase [Fimbriimonadales bacterium]